VNDRNAPLARPAGDAELPPHRRSIADYGRALRSGALTAQASTESCLARIEAERALDAFAFVDAVGALASARAVDLQLAAHVALRALMGVPVALKDLYASAGMPLTAGSRVDVADRVPGEGTLVRALKRAGAIVVGKTRTTEFAFGTYNPTHPTSRNPSDRTAHRMPGGSSAGSAVAVAAGLCGLAFGTDTGGSVRQPAALCGTAGFKATAGRLPMDGVFPLSPTFDSPGWFADRVEDLAAVWQLLSGEPPARTRAVDAQVFGVPDAHFFEGLEPDVAQAFELAQRRLAAAGARIVPVTLPSLADLDVAFGAFLSAELLAFLGRERVTANLSQMDPVVAGRIAPGLTLSADAYLDMRRRFTAIADAAARAIAGVDVVLTPTCPRVAALVAGHESPDAAAAWSRETLRFTRPGNLFGFCGVSLPIHRLVGTLPVGLQLLARGGDDANLLATAASVERLLGVPAGSGSGSSM
jgi:aspartyl-tRNA(Asn)/glutamyl-tRNA(Gln) amidotransferase subunit A